ncbi:LCP family protein required for cell wall assembly [Clostridium acetobutylicum]|uniref:Membrane bound transcriptional regulator of LytR family n=1 Tax=Clostridium acetobutylicum (strain ATCC 824 / DSM 792 / JCM 1419 / IAM 19013 / LMG 5710 / NBRC 13948 / NRRL B-527 / VKM B-1787 / 2291 / W) TaxID=272562 RepID=Q97JL0_CLOAB|nr:MULTISPECIES: LCP family protein [Clostridium]AAK79235.1 Membrane bound transcriptional regulator of LytR family [Clostridium acetobutylicum ATCC 824]ADZ20315.1 Membrane bound transcriptional regulator of LytR family [Clostridium acetobutylicum EA 2018]AEI34727.1 LytR family transcriptional regulator [Clostridium acetobutylicum DSM 1731]AWV81515.1 LytR family transcriptional regulator [Clostridium acetobutylicum]MBC2393154.1 LCP family protein [Clostridium acetobutylicum]
MYFNKKRVIIVCCFVLLCIAIGLGSFFYVSLFSTSTNSKNINVAAVTPKNNEAVNILITGVDTGRKESEFGDYSKRNDAIMVLHYDSKNKSANLVSIPRDTKVTIDGNTKKINELSSINGPKYLVSAIKSNFGININYYLQLDYKGFRNMVDSIGGVNVTINNKMNYDDPNGNIHIHLNKGENQKLDGKTAEEFVRWEKNNNSEENIDSDLARIRNQHEFVAAVVQNMKRKSMIFKMPSLLKVVAKNVQTNMTASDIYKYGKALASVKSENLKITSINGTNVYIGGNTYFVYNHKENKNILTTGNKVKVSKPSLNYKIEILNGTDKNGLAKQYKDILVAKGFQNDFTTGNYPKKPVKNTKVTLYGIDEEDVPYIKSKLSLSNVELISKKTEKFDIIILQGEDFK